MLCATKCSASALTRGKHICIQRCLATNTMLRTFLAASMSGQYVTGLGSWVFGHQLATLIPYLRLWNPLQLVVNNHIHARNSLFLMRKSESIVKWLHSHGIVCRSPTLSRPEYRVYCTGTNSSSPACVITRPT